MPRNLTTYCLLLTTHYLLLTNHYSLLTTYTHYSLLTTHYLLLTTYYLLLTTYHLLLTTHYSLLTTYYLLLTTHYSLLTLTIHYSLLTTYYSLRTTYYLLLTTYYLLLTTHYLLLTTYYSLLTTYYLLLTTYYLLLTTYYLLLATYYLLLTTYYLLLTYQGEQLRTYYLLLTTYYLLTKVSNFEWCLGTVVGTCDESLAEKSVAPPAVGERVNKSDGGFELMPRTGPDGVSTVVTFKGDSSLEVGSELYLGVRSGNGLGMWGSWSWSPPTLVGKSESSVEPGAAVLMNIEFTANASSGQDEASGLNALAMGQGSNASSNVSYEELSAETMDQYLAVARCYDDFGCLPFWKADGKCHEACNNTYCNFDDGDCTIPGAEVVSNAPLPDPSVFASFGRRLSEGSDTAPGANLSLVWRAPKYFYPAATKFNLSVGTTADLQLEPVGYLIQYNPNKMMQVGKGPA